MKHTIYLTDQAAWRERAEGQRLERASGEARPAGPCWWETGTGTAGTGKVIDLAAWKTENLMELDELDVAEETDGFDGLESGLAAYEGRELHRRPRQKHRAALALGELAATLSAAGVMVAMILRVLVF